MDELRFDGMSLQNGAEPGAATIWLDLISGYAEPAEVRGEDDVIPEAAGQEYGARIRDHRIIQLSGHVRGVGATVEARRTSWRAATDALMAKMQLYASPDVLELVGPYLGLTAGVTRTINAYCIRVVPGPISGTMTYQEWSIQLKAIGSPPEWSTAP